jgi:hypothetical protein
MAFPISPLPAGSTALYPTSGTPANTLAATGFIPEIWSGKMVEKFYNSTVLAAISNTDYEGEIKSFGDKVHIRTKPTITIKVYSADGLLVPDRPAGGEVILNIDQGRYWNTILDDVMRTQSDINLLSIWAEDAAEQMKITIDTDVLLNILGQAASPANRGLTAGAATGTINLGVTGTPLVLAPTAGSGVVDILDAILRLGQCLDEQNIPETGRWLVLPAWAATQIKRSELRQAYLSGDAVSMLRNGRIGMVDRFTIYSSNLLPKGVITGPPALATGETVMYAGHPHALTFASQMTEMEVMRSEHTFGNLQRGLQVYGYKVVAPVALAQAIIKPAP